MTRPDPRQWSPVPGVRSDLLQWLPDKLRHEFSALARIRHVRAGELIFQRGDIGTEMYRVLHGTVRVSTMRRDGHQMIYALLGPGECIATGGLIDGKPLPHTADALDDVQLQVISGAAFRRLRNASRDFDDALLRLMSWRMEALSAQMANLMLADLPSRVIRCLLELAKISGGRVITVTTTQGEIAQLVGASRQTINKILKQLDRERLIALSYRRIDLLDVGALRARAELV